MGHRGDEVPAEFAQPCQPRYVVKDDDGAGDGPFDLVYWRTLDKAGDLAL